MIHGSHVPAALRLLPLRDLPPMAGAALFLGFNDECATGAASAADPSSVAGIAS